jgi:hypothetical protein
MVPLLMVPSGDEDWASDAATFNEVFPLDGVTVSTAVGTARETITCWVAVAFTPLLSVTVPVTVKVPSEL